MLPHEENTQVAMDSPAGDPTAALEAMHSAANQMAANPVHPVRPMSGASATARAPSQDTGPVDVRMPEAPQPADTPSQGPDELARISPERLDELEKGYLRQDRFTKGMQELAEKRRALEERERAIQAREAAGPPQAPSAPKSAFDDSLVGQLDEEIPGLGGALRTLSDRLGDVASRQDQQDAVLRQRQQEEQRRSVEEEEDVLLDQAMQEFEGEPFFDRQQILNVMAEGGLGRDPALFRQHVDMAYRTIASFKLGRLAGSKDTVRRAASAPPVMGSAPTAMGGGLHGPEQLAAETGGRVDESWSDVTRRAMRGLGYDPDSSI